MVSKNWTTNNITLEDLKYIKRKYINKEDLLEAIIKIVNAIFLKKEILTFGPDTKDRTRRGTFYNFAAPCTIFSIGSFGHKLTYYLFYLSLDN